MSKWEENYQYAHCFAILKVLKFSIFKYILIIFLIVSLILEYDEANDMLIVHINDDLFYDYPNVDLKSTLFKRN